MEPDDEEPLAAALVEAVERPGRAPAPRRGRRARRAERFAWPALAERVARVFDDVAGVADEQLDAVSS